MKPWWASVPRLAESVRKTLPAFASGEEDIVRLYDDALAEISSDPAMAEILTHQKDNLVEKISEMKKLAT